MRANKKKCISNTIQRRRKDCLKWLKGNEHIKVLFGTLHLYPSKRGVDGRLDTIQHTNKEHFPFWVVDLGKIYDKERTEVYNEPSCCGKRLCDLDVLIGPYHNAMKLCAHYAGPSHTGDHLVFKCGLPGRYVKLMMRTTEYLHVAEGYVFMEKKHGHKQRIISRNRQLAMGRPNDCNDIPDKCPSGVYKVFPNQTQGFNVYCEMNLDEGHWTVSNDNLHSLTSQYNYKIRIDLIDFDGNTAFAKYKNFAIGDESSKFKLTVDGYHGTAGNSMEYHSDHGFSTKDRDNDNGAGHCALDYRGAWWFNKCVTADLNGQYFLKTPDSAHRGVYWRAWKGSNYSLKGSLMMIRRI
ncbi:unnamed protein product [Mytilus edulis]|uniref:Fibrinogen C-terminal domain-containing protein n=1 Tax=Mytilus edulis TaxID=6550 RepID=A0A8S3RYA4_MYTED|nr:unnamed protein product [Mytilus edulis]